MFIFILVLLCVAVSILFLFEESCTACVAVGLLVGLCIVVTLYQLALEWMPQEWQESLPDLIFRWGIWHSINLYDLGGGLLALGIGAPLAKHGLYPLRNRLIAAFERRINKGN